MFVDPLYKEAIEDHMLEYPKQWTVYTVAAIVESTPSIILVNMDIEERQLLVAVGKLKPEDLYV